MRAMLEEWSLRAAVPKTRMPVFLLHGRSDPFVPPSESVRLAAEARRRGPGAGGVHLMVAESMSHVDPGGGTGWSRYLEGIRLLGFVSRVLTAMEGG
jgi:pimeloyl-ACP methyl ester carboxylesterase